MTDETKAVLAMLRAHMNVHTQSAERYAADPDPGAEQKHCLSRGAAYALGSAIAEVENGGLDAYRKLVRAGVVE